MRGGRGPAVFGANKWSSYTELDRFNLKTLDCPPSKSPAFSKGLLSLVLDPFCSTRIAFFDSQGNAGEFQFILIPLDIPLQHQFAKVLSTISFSWKLPCQSYERRAKAFKLSKHTRKPSSSRKPTCLCRLYGPQKQIHNSFCEAMFGEERI